MAIATLQTPLGADALVLLEMDATEALGRPFRYEFLTYSPSGEVELEALLGESVTVTLHEQDDSVARHFHGQVASYTEEFAIGMHVRYRLVVRPALALLEASSNSRIFQGMTVPEVVQQVLKERGVAVEPGLTDRGYRTWEYLVQYRESDFNFIHRIMEQEGIYYYFDHKESEHVMVLADGPASHDDDPKNAQVPFVSQEQSIEGIDHWQWTAQLQSGAVALKDFNYTHPRGIMLVRRDAVQQPNTGYEMYSYPGEYETEQEGERYARLQIERWEALHATYSGNTGRRSLIAGGLFSLTEHEDAAQNQQYLVTSLQVNLQGAGPEVQQEVPGPVTCRCQLMGIPSKVTYRPGQGTPKPLISGPQTATVAGKDGEEIWTDLYGRIKVKFHWDLEDRPGEERSCFVRVAQSAASTGWGSIHIPRVGDEVVVEFLEGDPDRPIVLGGVYNDDNRPPYTLPENQTQSGIKTRSTKGGAAENCNEIRFEDKKGSEHLFVQAEKDLQINVKNDETRTVGANQQATIVKNQTLNVQGSQAITIDGGQDNAGVTGTSLQVTGEWRANTTKDILIESETRITFKVGETTIVMLPDKITLQAKGGAVVELTEDILARANGQAQMTLDESATVSSKDGSKMALNSNAELSTPKNATVKGQTTKLNGASGSVTADAKGVATKGTKVSHN